MPFSGEKNKNRDFVERKSSPGEQLQFQFGEAWTEEKKAWIELLGKKTKNFRIPDLAKFIGAGLGAGFLIGTAWYLKGGQKVAEVSESLGWKLAKVVKDALEDLHKK